MSVTNFRQFTSHVSIALSVTQLLTYGISLILMFMSNGVASEQQLPMELFRIFFVWVGLANIPLVMAQIYADIRAQKITQIVYWLAVVNILLAVTPRIFLIGLY